MAWGCIVLLAVPASAADSGNALLYAKGSVLVDGKAVTDSSAVAPGNAVQTGENSSASITVAGSTVMVAANSQLTFQPDAITLQHGAVSVGTSSRMRVKIGCLEVTPVGAIWTKYEVVDASGVAKVAARKESVLVENGSRLQAASNSKAAGGGSQTLSEGHEAARDETCAVEKHPQTAPVSGTQPFYAQPYFLYGTIAAAAVFTVWILWPCDDPVSPSAPASSNGNNCN
jgi:hypothetical protein